MIRYGGTSKVENSIIPCMNASVNINLDMYPFQQEFE